MRSLLLLALAATARGQSLTTTVVLTALEENHKDPTVLTATVGIFGLSLDTAQNRLTVAPTLFAMSGVSVVNIHLHAPATFGTDANMQYAFDAATIAAVVSGATVTVTVPSTLTAWMQQGLAYFNIHTTQYSGGAFRGAVGFDGTAFAVLTEQQVVTTTVAPPLSGIGAGGAGVNSTGQALTEFGPSSAGWGVASVVVSSTSLALSVTAYSLSSAAGLAVSLHGPALPGGSAGAVAGCAATPTVPAMATPPALNASLTATATCSLAAVPPSFAADLRAGKYYITVSSAAFADGELRGALLSPAALDTTRVFSAQLAGGAAGAAATMLVVAYEGAAAAAGGAPPVAAPQTLYVAFGGATVPASAIAALQLVPAAAPTSTRFATLVGANPPLAAWAWQPLTLPPLSPLSVADLVSGLFVGNVAAAIKSPSGAVLLSGTMGAAPAGFAATPMPVVGTGGAAAGVSVGGVVATAIILFIAGLAIGLLVQRRLLTPRYPARSAAPPVGAAAPKLSAAAVAGVAASGAPSPAAAAVRDDHDDDESSAQRTAPVHASRTAFAPTATGAGVDAAVKLSEERAKHAQSAVFLSPLPAAAAAATREMQPQQQPQHVTPAAWAAAAAGAEAVVAANPLHPHHHRQSPPTPRAAESTDCSDTQPLLLTETAPHDPDFAGGGGVGHSEQLQHGDDDSNAAASGADESAAAVAEVDAAAPPALAPAADDADEAPESEADPVPSDDLAAALAALGAATDGLYSSHDDGGAESTYGT